MFKTYRQIFRYDHPLLKLLASLLIATLVVYPAKEEHWLDILGVPSYRYLFLASAVVSYLVFSWIYAVSYWLTVQQETQKETQRLRWLWQVLAGVVVSFLFSYASSELYFSSMGERVALHYGRNTLPMFLFIIVCANLVYTYYLNHYTNLAETLSPYATVIAARMGKTILRIPVEQIAYVYHHNEVNWVQVFENGLKESETTFPPKYLLEDTLDGVEAKLNPGLFRKLNRQIVANKNAIREIRKVDRGLAFVLDPPCPDISLIKVSRDRKKMLEDWLMHCLSWSL